MIKNLQIGSQVNHQCPCCKKIHHKIPDSAKPYLLDDLRIQAWDWRCECGSNLYVKNYEKLTDIVEAS